MTPDPWQELADELRAALLDLPLDGLLDLLTRDLALSATWLLPTRLLLELSGAPPGCAPSLLRDGWTTSGAGGWYRSRPSTGRRAASEEAAVAALAAPRGIGVIPDDVELWRPRCDPEAQVLTAGPPATTEPLW